MYIQITKEFLKYNFDSFKIVNKLLPQVCAWALSVALFIWKKN